MHGVSRFIAADRLAIVIRCCVVLDFEISAFERKQNPEAVYSPKYCLDAWLCLQLRKLRAAQGRNRRKAWFGLEGRVTMPSWLSL